MAVTGCGFGLGFGLAGSILRISTAPAAGASLITGLPRSANSAPNEGAGLVTVATAAGVGVAVAGSRARSKPGVDTPADAGPAAETAGCATNAICGRGTAAGAVAAGAVTSQAITGATEAVVVAIVAAVRAAGVLTAGSSAGTLPSMISATLGTAASRGSENCVSPVCGASRVGIGSGGSRLLRGNDPEHEALEAEAAAHFGSEAALFFASQQRSASS